MRREGKRPFRPLRGGKYLAPEGKGRADVVILEGSEVIKERTGRVGMELISSGRAKRLAVVYYVLRGYIPFKSLMVT
jgi:hypothetical protein